MMRTETDAIGNVILEDDIIYGIHSYRSQGNFIRSGERINLYLVKSYLMVKLASCEANFNCGLLSQEKYQLISKAIELLLEETENNLSGISDTIFQKIIVDPYQGGAGTSLNMNINEVIANTALSIAGKNYGEYSCIHPIDDVNLSQSTNDTFPTALKIASIFLLRELASSFAALQKSFQEKETEFNNILKLGRTEFQDAVPIILGQEFGAYAQAVARDRWRLYNGEERLRSVNLGGTAVGNSVSANRDYVLTVNSILNRVTGLPVSKAEDLIDATQNLDVFVETHGLIKAGAVSVIKICNDLRFLSSGPEGGIGEIILPAMQAGSSIMPGKVNPVIPEHAIQICELIKGNDVIISNLVSAGSLELNAFMPLIAHLFLKSLQYLRDSNYLLAEKCVTGIKVNKERCKSNLVRSSAVAASLINTFGYDLIADAVKTALLKKISFVEELKSRNLLTEEELYSLLSKEMGIKN